MLIHNCLLQHYQSTLKNTDTHHNNLLKELTLNRKGDISSINEKLGTRALGSSKHHHMFLKQMSYGQNFLNTCIASLKNIKKDLENNSDIKNIVQSLYNTNFTGKNLFDGSCAKVSNVDGYLLPPNHSPLYIQLGENPSYKLDITIPKLLPSDGGRHNPINQDSFYPIFSLTNETRESIYKLCSIPVTLQSGTHGLIHQRELITQTLLAGVTIEQDVFRQCTLSEFDYIVSKLATPESVSALSIKSILQYVKTAAQLKTLSYIDANAINKTIVIINNVIDNALPAVLTTDDAKNVIDQIPHSQEINRIQRLFYNVAEQLLFMNYPLVLGYNAAQTKLYYIKQFLNGYADKYSNAEFPAQLYLGDKKEVKLNNAINILDSVISYLLSQNNNLKFAKQNITILIKESEDAADHYLNINLEEIITKLLELSRKKKIFTFCFCLEERILNDIYKNLCSYLSL